MNALEFSAKIEQGIIRLPVKYQEYENSYVRIIVLVDNDNVATLTKKEKMRLALQNMQKNNLFASTDNPTQWQKEQRDEWE